ARLFLHPRTERHRTQSSSPAVFRASLVALRMGQRMRRSSRTAADERLTNAREWRRHMIELKDLAYVRLGASDLEDAQSFATRSLGLQVGEQSAKSLHLRSDDRAHTLCYFEGDPRDQTVAVEVTDEDKLEA